MAENFRDVETRDQQNDVVWNDEQFDRFDTGGSQSTPPPIDTEQGNDHSMQDVLNSQIGSTQSLFSSVHDFSPQDKHLPPSERQSVSDGNDQERTRLPARSSNETTPTQDINSAAEPPREDHPPRPGQEQPPPGQDHPPPQRPPEREAPREAPRPGDAGVETNSGPGQERREGRFLDSPIPADQLKDLEPFKLSPEQLEKIRKEVNEQGQDPEKVLPELMKNNRVLAMGESHDDVNPQREMGAKMMAKLKESGATHLAIEAPPSAQAAIDEFMKTGKLDGDAFPGLFKSESFVKLMQEARNAGLKIVAVDAERQNDRGGQEAPRSGGESSRVDRDATMARNIGNILEADKNNKVVFWVGSGHLDNPKNSESVYRGAGQILKDKYSVATVLDQGPQQLTNSLANITRDIKSPAIVATPKTPELAGITRNTPDYVPRSHYRDYDYVIMYPHPTR